MLPLFLDDAVDYFLLPLGHKCPHFLVIENGNPSPCLWRSRWLKSRSPRSPSENLSDPPEDRLSVDMVAEICHVLSVIGLGWGVTPKGFRNALEDVPVPHFLIGQPGKQRSCLLIVGKVRLLPEEKSSPSSSMRMANRTTS